MRYCGLEVLATRKVSIDGDKGDIHQLREVGDPEVTGTRGLGLFHPNLKQGVLQVAVMISLFLHSPYIDVISIQKMPVLKPDG